MIVDGRGRVDDVNAPHDTPPLWVPLCGVDTLSYSDTAFSYGRVSRQRVHTPTRAHPLQPPSHTFLHSIMSDHATAKKRKMSEEQEDKAQLAPVSNLLIKRLSPKAKLPTRGSPLAAGYDLYRFRISRSFSRSKSLLVVSAERKVIPAHGKALIDTQLSIAVPAGTYGRVAPRSGLGNRLPQDLSTHTDAKC